MKYNFNSRQDLAVWLAEELVSTSEVLEILDCSRQNLHSFVKRGRLVPVKESSRERLFWRSDVFTLKEETAKFNHK